MGKVDTGSRVRRGNEFLEKVRVQNFRDTEEEVLNMYVESGKRTSGLDVLVEEEESFTVKQVNESDF